MPLRSALLSSICRLAVYAAALVVLATARPPQPRTDASMSAARVAQPAAPAANAAWRLVIAGVLLAGITLELHRRRAVWH
jgi:hypothetical protein